MPDCSVGILSVEGLLFTSVFTWLIIILASVINVLDWQAIEMKAITRVIAIQIFFIRTFPFRLNDLLTR